jgi:hypothetical protein
MIRRQGEVGRLLYLNFLKSVGIADDAIASQCSGFEAAAIWLTIIGMLQQNADNLHTEPLLQFLVADIFTQDWVDLYDTLSHTDVTLHRAVLCEPMGTEYREQGLLAEEPTFGYL